MDFKYIPTYEECLSIADSSASFVAKREELDGVPIVSFAYRLILLEDFAKFKGARNLRGITFREDTGELVALPFHKFWGLNENEYTQLDRVKCKGILRVTEKYDGSLVYFFMLSGKLYCKTKLNSFSEQAARAMSIVEENRALRDSIVELIRGSYTPLFEYIAPTNQVVIPYAEERLKYICSRSMKDGTYNFDYFEGCDPVDTLLLESLDSVVSMVKDYRGHEGLVVVFKDHDMVKVKTEEYIQLHKVASNILNESTLAYLILTESLDDAKNTLLSANSNLLEYVSSFERKVVNSYNKFVKAAENFYKLNRELTRKDYAVKAQAELDQTSFGLAMELYSKGKVDESKFREKFVNKKLWN